MLEDYQLISLHSLSMPHVLCHETLFQALFQALFQVIWFGLPISAIRMKENDGLIIIQISIQKALNSAVFEALHCEKDKYELIVNRCL